MHEPTTRDQTADQHHQQPDHRWRPQPSPLPATGEIIAGQLVQHAGVVISGEVVVVVAYHAGCAIEESSYSPASVRE